MHVPHQFFPGDEIRIPPDSKIPGTAEEDAEEDAAEDLGQQGRCADPALPASN